MSRFHAQFVNSEGNSTGQSVGMSNEGNPADMMALARLAADNVAIPSQAQARMQRPDAGSTLIPAGSRSALDHSLFAPAVTPEFWTRLGGHKVTVSQLTVELGDLKVTNVQVGNGDVLGDQLKAVAEKFGSPAAVSKASGTSARALITNATAEEQHRLAQEAEIARLKAQLVEKQEHNDQLADAFSRIVAASLSSPPPSRSNVNPPIIPSKSSLESTAGRLVSTANRFNSTASHLESHLSRLGSIGSFRGTTSDIEKPVSMLQRSVQERLQAAADPPTFSSRTFTDDTLNVPNVVPGPSSVQLVASYSSRTLASRASSRGYRNKRDHNSSEEDERPNDGPKQDKRPNDGPKRDQRSRSPEHKRHRP